MIFEMYNKIHNEEYIVNVNDVSPVGAEDNRLVWSAVARNASRRGYDERQITQSS